VASVLAASFALIVGVLVGAMPSVAAAWSPIVWQLEASGVTGDPAAVNPPSRAYADVFIRQGSRVIQEHYREGSRVVTDLGGIATSNPAAAATDDATYVFAVGADQAVWYRRAAADGTMTEWATLGGIARRNPAAALDPYGVVHVYAIGTDDGVYTRSLTGGVWSQWQALGGIVTSDPAAWPGGVAARGLDGAAWFTRGAVWESLGGFIADAPAVGPTGDFGALAPDGRLFIRGADSWRDTGGLSTIPPTLAPASTAQIGFSLNYYGRGLDGHVYLDSWGRGHTGWFDQGGVATSRIAAAVVQWGSWCDYYCQGQVVYAVGTDGGLYLLAT
jgi:hypothetical protein